MEKRELLARLAVRYEGSRKMILAAAAQGEHAPDVRIPDAYLTILDSGYPSCLRQLQNPPLVLFYEGNPDLLLKRKVSIVGSRQMTEYGSAVTGIAADILKKRYVIVSGLAKGVDAEAHRRALNGGSTIAVIGSGLGTEYPSCNRELYRRIRREGLLLTEFPHDTPVRRYHFPWRNRIIAALGDFTVVTQAYMKSGTMHTVNEALELGKDIYCAAYPFEAPEGEFCAELIREGAGILYSRRQLEELCRDG